VPYTIQPIIESAYSNMATAIEEHQSLVQAEIIHVLAEKYKFDADEAMDMFLKPSNTDNLPPPIIYQKKPITYGDISAFTVSTKSLNDKNNTLRERIIGAIINKQIPENYYTTSDKWTALKLEINNYITLIAGPMDQGDTVRCEHKGGRKFHYDFGLIIKETRDLHIELKFNATHVCDAPQFVSPMYPSQYTSSSFESLYFDKYLPLIAAQGKLELPNREIYMKEIHNNKPACMKAYQEKYYKGCKGSSKFTNDEADIVFYQYCKDQSKSCIDEFITSTELDLETLSAYLKSTQKNKMYMLYKDGKFHVDHVNMDNYELMSYESQPSKSRFVATSKTGNKIKILLRWKNGNGIAYPAFQIS